MRVSARLLAAGGTALALGVLLLAVASPGGAAGDKPPVWQPVIPAADGEDTVRYLGRLALDTVGKAPAGGDARQEWTDKLKSTGLLVAAVTASTKGGEADPQLTAARAAALKLTEAVDRGNVEAARAQASALAGLKPRAPGNPQAFGPEKVELLDVMNLLRLRKQGGLGFGITPPARAENTDGVEAKLIGLSKRPLAPAQMTQQADDLARSAYVLVAICGITDAHAPKKKGNTGKGLKEWAGWTGEMRAAALELAGAAKKKDSAGVKKAVNKLNSTCSNCHGEFRD